MAFHGGNRDNRIFKLRAGFIEIIAAKPHRQRQPFRPNSAHRVNRFQVKAHAVFQAAAIGIAALIGDGGQETRAQIAMGEMQFQPFKPGSQGAARSIGIALMQRLDFRDAEFMHRVDIAPAIGNGGWGPHLPAIRMIRGQLLLAMPGFFLTALAPSMAKLRCRHRAHILDHRSDAREAFDLVISINARTACAGAPIWRDGQLLRENQTKTASGTRAEQHQMEVAHHPVFRPVHGHGRHHEPIAQRDILEREG